MDGWMDGWMDRRMGWMDGWMDGDVTAIKGLEPRGPHKQT